MGQWSELPGELLDEIEELLVLFVDKVQVRAVCMSWYSHLSKIPNHQVGRLPWLLQSFDNDKKASHGLFDIVDKKTYELDLPEAQGKLFKGSSHGWLVTVEDIPLDIPDTRGNDIPKIGSITSSPADMYLINPLTKKRIQLPPRYTFPDVDGYDANRGGCEYALLDKDEVLPDTYAAREGNCLTYASLSDMNIHLMDKVVLSSTPSEDCIVVAIFGNGQVAWCKCNDKEWKHLRTGRRAVVEDLIFHKGKLHALNCLGELLVFENICLNPEVKLVGKLPSSIHNRSHVVYLVECSDGELVMVMRYVDEFEEGDSMKECTFMFEVCKLDSINSIWIPVKNIGEDILFLGLNSSFSLPSRDFPGCKGNCIYFTDSTAAFETRGEIFGRSDIGVFNLED